MNLKINKRWVGGRMGIRGEYMFSSCETLKKKRENLLRNLHRRRKIFFYLWWWWCLWLWSKKQKNGPLITTNTSQVQLTITIIMIYSLSHATQVLAALVYLHIMGIFHRDKSFINIILTIIITIITIIINKTNNNKNRYWRRWYTFTVLSCPNDS